MKEFAIDPQYYHNIQLIIGIAIKRHNSRNIVQNPYAEMAAILQRTRHRIELAYSPDIDEITICLNWSELWALKLAIDDLSTDPCDDVPESILCALNNYLKQFNAAT